MKFNGINAIVATLLSGLLAWWLWSMGINDMQKWLLAGLGGAVMEIGFLFGMGVSYSNPRSGVQVRIVMNALAVITFGACCIYSFFEFSPQGFCIPIGVFAILCSLLAQKIYKTKE